MSKNKINVIGEGEDAFIIGEGEKYVFKERSLREIQKEIKNLWNEETILKEDLKLNFFEKIKLLLTKKEIIIFNREDRFGYHPKMIFKKFKNHKILLKYIQGSTKELL